MKRYLVIVGCIFAAFVLPSQARSYGARKTVQRIVLVPSVGTANLYEEGNGPEEAIYRSVKEHPSATQFKIVWHSAVFNTGIAGAAVYNRAKRTMRVYDAEGSDDMMSRTHNVFSNVDDEVLKRLAANPFYQSPNSISNGSPSSYFEGLKSLGCPRRTLLHYEHRYKIYHH